MKTNEKNFKTLK